MDDLGIIFQGLLDCAKDIAKNGPMGFFKVGKLMDKL